MSIADVFANIALGFSNMLGVGYWDAWIIDRSDIEYDSGGSVVPGSGGATYRSCSAQVDVATEAMRLAEGFTEEDRRILVLSATLEGVITTDSQIEILEGPYVGIWNIESVGRDPAAIYFELRGRRA